MQWHSLEYRAVDHRFVGGAPVPAHGGREGDSPYGSATSADLEEWGSYRNPFSSIHLHRSWISDGRPPSTRWRPILSPDAGYPACGREAAAEVGTCECRAARCCHDRAVRAATGTVDSELRRSLKRRGQLLKVDRVSDLDTEPQPVLVDVGTNGRTDPGALLKERVLGKHRREAGKLIVHGKRDGQRANIDLRCLPAADGLRDAVRGRERDDEAAYPGGQADAGRERLGVVRPPESARSPHGAIVFQAQRADLQHLHEPRGCGRTHGCFGPEPGDGGAAAEGNRQGRRQEVGAPNRRRMRGRVLLLAQKVEIGDAVTDGSRQSARERVSDRSLQSIRIGVEPGS